MYEGLWLIILSMAFYCDEVPVHAKDGVIKVSKDKKKYVLLLMPGADVYDNAKLDPSYQFDHYKDNVYVVNPRKEALQGAIMANEYQKEFCDRLARLMYGDLSICGEHISTIPQGCEYIIIYKHKLGSSFSAATYIWGFAEHYVPNNGPIEAFVKAQKEQLLYPELETAIKWYTGSGSSVIRVRHPVIPKEHLHFEEQMKKYAVSLKGLKLFQGYSRDEGAVLKKGEALKWHTAISTTWDIHVANHFTKGKRTIAVHTFHDSAKGVYARESAHGDGEKEIILAPGHYVRLDEIEYVSFGFQIATIYHCTVFGASHFE